MYLNACSFFSFYSFYEYIYYDEQSVVSAFSKKDKIGDVVTFSVSDFTSGIKGDNTLDAIVIAELPESGNLFVGENTINAGDVVYHSDLNNLTYSSDKNVEISDFFTIIPVFSKTGSAEKVVITLSLTDRINYAPVAVNESYKTYADIKLKGTFSAIDTDGDDCVYTITKEPKKGTVLIDGNGFEYEPKRGKSGKDSFEFTATDKYGNVSNAAKITIEIVKSPARESFSYSDMIDSDAHFAALYLREEGIMVGETFGEENFFYPETPVTRAQFIALVAAVSDMALPTVSVGTGLSDNDNIPNWARPYVAAAINCGVICGENSNDGNKVFRANDYITRAEAATILDRAMGLSNENRIMTFADSDTVPAWAEQSLINTTVNGIISVYDDNTIKADCSVTREDVAKMLYETICYNENKNDSKNFWEKLFD